MRRLAAVLLVLSLTAAPAAAEEQRRSPGELVDEAAQTLLQALRAMLQAIPQYAAPEINDNGDIIIRRIRPEDKPEPPAEPDQPDRPLQTRI